MIYSLLLIFRIRFSVLAQLLGLALLPFLVGCDDDQDTVRQLRAARQARQQAETKVDHLAEAISLVSRLIELDPSNAGRQILYHLNSWSDSQTRPETGANAVGKGSAVSQEFRPTRLLRTVDDVIPYDKAIQAVSQDEFVPQDVYHLRYSYLTRKVSDWVLEASPSDPLFQSWIDENRESIGGENADLLSSTLKLFDWTTRNIALEPMVFGDNAPPVPQLPLTMEFRGAGYRQTPYQTLFRGTGDALQRTSTFISLCRQASIPVCLLATVDGAGRNNPWLSGAMIGNEVYLFDCAMGTPVPGPNQVGIATLQDARRDASVLRRMSVPGFFDYPIQKNDVQQCVALLMLEPETISLRSKRLQESLTGDLRLVLYEDADALADKFESISGIATTRMWDVPLKARIYDAAMEQVAQKDPLVAFFMLSSWAILDGQFDQAKRLALGRWRHLQGQFSDDEDRAQPGAKSLYLSQRQPEFEIADLRIDVELQKQYGIRRDLGVTPEVYDRQIQQVQQIMRQGKITATFWLGLIQYEDGRFDLGENWFGTRVIGTGQASRWEQSARYSWARSLEAQGKYDEAIALYKTEGDVQEHGNRIRARLVAKRFGSTTPDDELDRDQEQESAQDKGSDESKDTD